MANDYRVNGKAVTDDIAAVLEQLKNLEHAAPTLSDKDVNSGAEANTLLNRFFRI